MQRILLCLVAIAMAVLGVQCDQHPATTAPMDPRGTVKLREIAYVRDRFFFYQRPDTTDESDFLTTYGIDPDSLFDDAAALRLSVFVDTQDATTLPERPYRGFAIADLATTNAAAIQSAYEAAGTAGRFPSSSNDPGAWQRVPVDDIGRVAVTWAAGKKSLGFFFLSGPVQAHTAIGVLDEGPAARWGSISGNEVRLRLVRHPEQDADYAAHPSAAYMMRHVYILGGMDLRDIDVQIPSLDPARRDPRAPLRAPMSTYLHMFGLDDFDNATGTPVPDGKVDNDINRIDAVDGFLFMPGVRPFSPSLKLLKARFAAAGVATDSVESLAESLDRKSTRLNSSHLGISYAVFC